jgi:hypothetical protein
MTKIDFGYKPRIDQITKITGFSDLWFHNS